MITTVHVFAFGNTPYRIQTLGVHLTRIVRLSQFYVRRQVVDVTNFHCT